jgi:hypothetical protein
VKKFIVTLKQTLVKSAMVPVEAEDEDEASMIVQDMVADGVELEWENITGDEEYEVEVE